MLRYKFYCPVCKKEVKRKEVMPVVEGFENTPKGSPRSVILRAFHFPNCKNTSQADLQITVLEGKQVQNKLFYSYDETKSGRDKHDKR